MKTVILLVQAFMVAVVSAQAYLTADKSYKCVAANGAYCAGVTGDTNIIIRCVDGWGHTDKCDDLLSGEAPAGNSWAPCWQASPLSGGAACSKNGTVYPSSVFDPTFNTTAPFPIPGSVASNHSSVSSTDSGSSSPASSSDTQGATSTTTVTSTSTRTRTATSYVSSNGTTFAITEPMTTTSLEEGTFSLAAFTTSTFTDDATVYVTHLTSINTTICPETSSTPSLTVFALASSATLMSPVFSVVTNTTTLDLGPGPVSITPFNSTSMSANSTVGSVNSSLAGALGATVTAIQSSGAIAASPSGDNSTVVVSNTTASPSQFVGAAGKLTIINGMITLFCGLLAVVLL